MCLFTKYSYLSYVKCVVVTLGALLGRYNILHIAAVSCAGANKMHFSKISDGYNWQTSGCSQNLSPLLYKQAFIIQPLEKMIDSGDSSPKINQLMHGCGP